MPTVPSLLAPSQMRLLRRPPPPRAAGARVSQQGASARVAGATILVGHPRFVAITLNRLYGAQSACVTMGKSSKTARIGNFPALLRAASTSTPKADDSITRKRELVADL